MTRIGLHNFHDSTLEKIEISLEDNSAVFKINIFKDGIEQIAIIKASAITDFNLPRYQPWGPSKFVNKAWEENSGEAEKICIELQSGDIVCLRAAKYELSFEPGVKT